MTFGENMNRLLLITLALGDIIAYRITGVDRAGGFTDCTNEVTE